jgi:DNA-binding winged helix-turn-helix (wHTH) protein
MDLDFGNFRLKRTERLLLGPEGPVELSARSFDILAILLERPDEVIGKTELFDAVWPGRVVEENTLQVHISALRKLLSAEMIVTVHGRGYKYAGPRPFAAMAEAAAPARPSIAILPFDNMSGDPGAGLFQRRHYRRHHRSGRQVQGVSGDCTELLLSVPRQGE